MEDDRYKNLLDLFIPFDSTVKGELRIANFLVNFLKTAGYGCGLYQGGTLERQI
jgi:hypothetical protein